MANGEAVGDGHAERYQIGSEHLVEAECAVDTSSFEIGESPDQHTGECLKQSGVSEVSEHSVDPVELFTHILEEEDGAAELRAVRSSDQALEQAQVTADERTLGFATAQGDDAVVAGNQYT